MMKIIDYVVKTSIVLTALLIMFNYGKKCPIDNNEGCINGVLVCNRVK